MGKKSFAEDNPALRFITQTDEDEKAERKAAKAKKKSSPKFEETKTRRVQLIMQPSLYDCVKAAAEKKGVSVNEYIHTVLEKSVRKK